MLKQQDVLVESIYNLGQLVNPELDFSELERILAVGRKQIEEALIQEVIKPEFTFTGKAVIDGEELVETPAVHRQALEKGIGHVVCHKEEYYIFTTDGRVYDVLSEGYIVPETLDNNEVVPVVIDRIHVNLPVEFITYYANTDNQREAFNMLEEALIKIQTSSNVEQNKRKEEARQLKLQKELEARSERYYHHTQTKGLKLLNTPYVLTEEGRVFDTDTGRIRSVNNRGYTTNIIKGLIAPINLSINNVKNILENKDFTVLIERAGYTEHQCEKMWEYYQASLEPVAVNVVEDILQEDAVEKEMDDLTRTAYDAGFIRTEEGYFVHKSQL